VAGVERVDAVEDGVAVVDDDVERVVVVEDGVGVAAQSEPAQSPREHATFVKYTPTTVPRDAIRQQQHMMSNIIGALDFPAIY
jgi:hypothetical protein